MTGHRAEQIGHAQRKGRRVGGHDKRDCLIANGHCEHLGTCRLTARLEFQWSWRACHDREPRFVQMLSRTRRLAISDGTLNGARTVECQNCPHQRLANLTLDHQARHGCFGATR